MVKGANFIWQISLLLVGCKFGLAAGDRDGCAECDAADAPGDAPPCHDDCAETAAPTWCVELPGSKSHWVEIVGLGTHPSGNMILLSVAANGTRKLVEFTPQGTIVSTRKLAGEGTPRALASDSEGIYVATNLGSGDSSAIEHFSYGGDLVWTQPIDRANLRVTSIDRHDAVFALAGTIAQPGSEDIWVGALDVSGGLRWDRTYDHAGFRDAATSVVFDGKIVAVAGNVQHEPLPYDDVPYPVPNFVYFAAYSALDGAVVNQEVITGEQVEGILEVSDMARFEDESWALVGTSTSGLLQSVWWTAIVDADGVRTERFEAEVGDNVTEAVATFGDAVLVGGRRGDPIPTATRVIGYDLGLSSLAWEWVDALPHDDARDIVGDMVVVDSSLYVSSEQDVQPLLGGNYTQSLTICSFNLL